MTVILKVPPPPRILKEGENPMQSRHEAPRYLSDERPFDWVDYATKKTKEYKREARSFHRKGYLEVALIFAGRRMALQDMLKEGGYPENVDKDSTLL